jgi:hypothetical protein
MTDSCCENSFHTSFAKGHSSARWNAVSNAWSHRLHLSLWGHPLLSNLSEVHNLFCSMSHMLNFIFPSAWIFQVLASSGLSILPTNCCHAYSWLAASSVSFHSRPSLLRQHLRQAELS